jgi:hypothetical protein
MPAVVGPALGELVDVIRAAGISTSTDPRDIHPPCALVVARTIRPKTSSRVEVEAEVLLIAPGVGNGDALEWLDGALAAVWAALPIRWPAELVATTGPGTGVKLLAYSLTRASQIDLPQEALHGQ